MSVNTSDTLNGLKDKDFMSIIKLRFAVGFIGEKKQHNWWSSSWMTKNASAFLSPIYGDRLDTARYHGVIEAARRIHDERIGVGRAFHLFRLPEWLERHLHEIVASDGAYKELSDPTEASIAEGALAELAHGSKGASPGPVRAGDISDLNGRKWIGNLAAHYRAAFEASQETFPYFSERQ